MMTQAAATTPPARVDVADQVKVVLTIAVIATHCAITYSSRGSWFYREDGSNPVSSVLGVPIALGALFAMGTFFFIAGCLVPSSLRRKGSVRFAPRSGATPGAAGRPVCATGGIRHADCESLDLKREYDSHDRQYPNALTCR
jgi:hypothetical protein